MGNCFRWFRGMKWRVFKSWKMLDRLRRNQKNVFFNNNVLAACRIPTWLETCGFELQIIKSWDRWNKLLSKKKTKHNNKVLKRQTWFKYSRKCSYWWRHTSLIRWRHCDVTRRQWFRFNLFCRTFTSKIFFEMIWVVQGFMIGFCIENENLLIIMN